MLYIGLDEIKPVFGISEKVRLKTSLLSYRDVQGYFNFACNKTGNYNFQIADAQVDLQLCCSSTLFSHPEDRFSCIKAHMWAGHDEKTCLRGIRQIEIQTSLLSFSE